MVLNFIYKNFFLTFHYKILWHSIYVTYKAIYFFFFSVFILFYVILFYFYRGLLNFFLSKWEICLQILKYFLDSSKIRNKLRENFRNLFNHFLCKIKFEHFACQSYFQRIFFLFKSVFSSKINYSISIKY